MIINTLSDSKRAVYYCNGSNDDEALVTFIANLRARDFNTFTVEIIGRFGKAKTTAISIDNSGYNQITLDFAQCNTIISRGPFLNVKNVKVMNCTVYHGADAADAGIYTISGTDWAVFENCHVLGEYASGDCRAFSLTNCKVINCEVKTTNNSGSNYGIYGFGLIVIGTVIEVTSANASAYGVESAQGSFISDCRFKGISNSTATTASGNGGIGGGYYSNCLFVGLGSLKGQGFYVRGGAWLSVNNCIFRGYTLNTATGWGIGLTGQANEATTLSLIGINCNQEALTGYSQTASMHFTGGYGAYLGIFYTAPTVNAEIKALAAYNRNRV